MRPPAARPPRGQARGRGGAAACGAGAALLRGLGRGGPRGGHLLAAAEWAWQLGGEPRPAPRRGAGGPGQCVLLLARCSCALQVVAGNKLYVAGGLARGAALDTLQVFDGDTWTWSLEQVSSSRRGWAEDHRVSEQSLHSARYGACAVAHRDYVLVVGGAR